MTERAIIAAVHRAIMRRVRKINRAHHHLGQRIFRVVAFQVKCLKERPDENEDCACRNKPDEKPPHWRMILVPN